MSRHLKLNWIVPENIPFFDGHFPGQPILPGFAIVDESLRFLREQKKDLPLAFNIQNAKFARPITPRMQIEVSAEQEAESTNRWVVRWSDATTQDELVLLSVVFG